ncbi:MAG TPA: RidA family protein [Corynebacteriales bacterium]|nr:RidA family protein [Mycobacteriales bacterium]
MRAIVSDKVYSTINSQGKKTHGLIFLVTVGKNPETGKFENGLVAQAKRAMENFKVVLEDNGSSMENIVKITVYLADLSRVDEFNKVYYSYFPDQENRPVRCCVGVELGGDAEVEMELVALAD